MTSVERARTLRSLAAAQGRAADRLTQLRLRLTRGIAQLDADARDGSASRIHEIWREDLFPQLGTVARGMRSSRDQLVRRAVAAERESGLRLGGYGGAGFLGSGDLVTAQVRELAAAAAGRLRDEERGAAHRTPAITAAEADGAPEPVVAGCARPRPSGAAGAGTPAYEDDEA